MLAIAEALDAVLKEARTLPGESCSLEQARGCVLDEDVRADADSPPFDKSVVDGYALRTADLDVESPEPSLALGELILAGQTPTRALARGEAAVIMTGAPLPGGCDAVVMHERTSKRDDVVLIDQTSIRPGQNILRRGAEMRSGEVVLPRGSVLHPAQLGVLASVGRTDVQVIPRPRVSIVSTGDELVEPGETPGPGQIRNSNAVMLRALATESGALATTLPIARDERDDLARILGQALEADLVLVTGGVSAGQRDLVPEALESLGVRRVFHKVNLKPGKPLWFGVATARPGRGGALVFGLPGNPVSGLVSFIVFVKPALAALAGRATAPAPLGQGRLARSFAQRGDRIAYFPAQIRPAASLDENNGDGLPSIMTLDWAGSADLRTVAGADGFAIFPAGDREYQAGEIVGYLPMR
jgi:molybdopterin molybdotransferase